jgi:hypothetical protein
MAIVFSLLLEAAAKSPQFPVAFTLVYAVGFVAAVGIGSIAWYNVRLAGKINNAQTLFLK